MPSLEAGNAGDCYLIEGVRRDAAGAITHVGWCRRKPYAGGVKTEVAEVIAALRDGIKVNVAVGFLIFHGVQVSADGTTIVDKADADRQPFGLADMPLI